MAKPLDAVTKKSKEIYASLSPTAVTALDQRLNTATKTQRKEMEDLLHFPYNKREGTSSDSRKDIRAAVTSYLSEGGTIAGAQKLRELLISMPANKTKKLSADMRKPGADHLKLLVDNIDLMSPKRREDFASFKGAIEGYPNDPTKVNQNIIGDAFVTIGRDSTGAVKVVNADAALTTVQIPGRNQNVTGGKLTNIKATFDDIAKMNYGRSTVPLDFVRHAREEHAKNGTSMSDALKTYQPKGGKLVETGKNGDCLSGAELLIAELDKQGITGYAAGTWNNELTQQRLTAGKQSPGDSGLQTGCVTHLDVIVPYTSSTGEERVLVLTPGMGTDPKFYKDMPMSELNGPNMASNRVRLSGDGIGVDSVVAQKSALGYLTNIQITNGPPGSDGNKQICGIDLSAGTLYINTAAGTAYKGARPEGTGGILMKFKDVADDPHGKVKLKTPDGKEVEITKAEALAVFAKGIQEQFNLEPEFVDNVMHLASNSQQYNQSVLWSSVQSMHGLDQGPKVTVTNQRLDQLPKPKVDAPKVTTQTVPQDDQPKVDPPKVTQSDGVSVTPKKKTVGDITGLGSRGKSTQQSQEKSVSLDKEKPDPSHLSVKDKIKLYQGSSTGGGTTTKVKSPK